MTRLKLLKIIDELDQESNQLFDALKKYSDQQLNHKANEGKWSAIQCLHHIMLSEKYSVQYCVKKLSFNPRLKKAGIKSKIKSFALRMIIQAPFKIKAPDTVGTPSLPLTESLENTRALWNENRENLRSFILDIDEKQRDNEIYKHPFGIRLSIPGMLSFFKYHFRRHQKQIKKALKNQS